MRDGERGRLERVRGALENQPTYRVELDVDPARRAVAGRISLTVVPRGRLTELPLRLTPNAAHTGAVKVSSFRRDGATLEVPEDEDPTLVRVPLEPPANAGKPLTISFALTARVPPAPEGGLLAAANMENPGDYGAFSAASDIISLAGLIPMWVPIGPNGQAFDGPAGVGDLGSFDPSNFLVQVTTRPGWRTLSPGVMTRQSEGSRPVTAWSVVGAREFPILVTRGYTENTSTEGDVTIECWTRPGAKGAAQALTAAAKSLTELENRLGPYPYKSLRVVEARFGGGAGGMEFPGLVTVSSTLLSGMGNPLEALGLGTMGAEEANGLGLGELHGALSQLLEATLEFTVAHEVVHQYFAMLVGNDPVAIPVVDEALTQHVALLVLEWVHGRAVADGLREAQLKAAYHMHRSAGGKDAVALRPAADFASNIEYAAIIYGKAPLLFDAWRARLGDGTWFSVLRTYVDRNRYRWVGPETLLNLAAAHDEGLKPLYKRWWLEKHGDEDLGSVEAGPPGSPGPTQSPDYDALENAMKDFERQ